MSANEMVRCEFRGDGFHVMAFRHNGKVVASGYKMKVLEHEWDVALDGGKREFLDEQDLSDFAKKNILPRVIKEMSKQFEKRISSIPIVADICDMAIGGEQPKLHGCVVAIGLFVMSLLSFSAMAETNVFKNARFEYDYVEDGIRITRVLGKSSGSGSNSFRMPGNELFFPDTIDGVEVVEVASNACRNVWASDGNHCEKISFPAKLKRLGANVFECSRYWNYVFRFPKTMEEIDSQFASFISYSGTCYATLDISIFDGPPPSFIGTFDGLGNMNNSAKVYVNDLYYVGFQNQSIYKDSYYGRGHYYKGALLCRGMPGLRIFPESGVLKKSDNSYVLLSCTNTNAEIFYTLDGSVPTTNETQKCFRYNMPIELMHPTTIKAIAVSPEYPYYTVEEKSFAVDQPDAPIVEAVDKIPFEARDYRVQIQSSDDGAVIRYTLDGSEVTESSRVYAGVFSISDTTTVRAKVFVEGRFASEETSVTFVRHWDTVATPIIYPSDTTFANISQEVIISCETEGAKIFYATDGSNPVTNGREYTKPFTVYSSCRVRAVAVKYDWRNSAEATAVFTRSESLSEAANFYGYTMDTDEVVPWVVDGEVSRDGVSSVRSGAIGNNGTTWLQTSIKKAGTVSFWWKAACEDADEAEGEDGYYDYGAFLVDDVVEARIAGHDGEWHYVSHEVNSGGKHTLKWEYRKDGVTSYAPDCIWVDQVQWVPADGSGYTLTTPEPVPYSWLTEYGLGAGTDFETAASVLSGKMQSGKATRIWEEFVAGTDPTNEASVLTATIEMRDGEPVVTWEPDLNESGTKSERLYKVYGKENLTDSSWAYPTNSLHRFFKVTVEMP